MKSKMTNYNDILIKAVLSVVAIAAFFSCEQSYDPAFSESPDERVAQALDDYQHLLMEAPFGWKATVHTGVGVSYLYYFDFNENGKVTMLADFNETTASAPASGDWVLKALQQPTLSFDTYSYIHLPADPDGSISGGTNGEGLVSDFEFKFTSVGEDTLKLTGIQRGITMTMVPATEQEKEILMRGEIKNMLHHVSSNPSTYLTLPNANQVTLAFGVDEKIVYALFLSEDGKNIQRLVSPFSFTTQGIWLQSPMEIQGYTFQELKWDSEEGMYTASVESSAVQIFPIEGIYFFNPEEPLAAAMGTTYTTLQIPAGSSTQPLPGQSEEFIGVYNRTAASLLNSEFRLTLQETNMKFDTTTHSVIYDMIVLQHSTLFLCRYIYAYTIDEEGIVSLLFDAADQNGWLIYDHVSELLTYFENNTFTLQYIGGGNDLIGGVFCQEIPDFYFSGYLRQDEVNKNK